MHTDSSSNASGTASSAFPVSASEFQGVSPVRPALTLWQRVDALRELLHQGSLLLGDVVTLTRNAEESLAAAASEKAAIEQCRHRLEEECLQLRMESHSLSSELEKWRSEATARRQGAEHDHTVSESSSHRISTLQAEIALLRSQAIVSSPSTRDSILIDDLKKRLQQTESQLQQSRATLVSERERRNRAISLIKPLSTESTPLQPSQSS